MDGQLDCSRRWRRRAPARVTALLPRGGAGCALGGYPGLTGVLQNHETDPQPAARAPRGRGRARGAGAWRLRGLTGAERHIPETPGLCGRHRGLARPADRGPGSGAERMRRKRGPAVACGRRPSQRARPDGLEFSASIHGGGGRGRFHPPVQRATVAGRRASSGDPALHRSVCDEEPRDGRRHYASDPDLRRARRGEQQGLTGRPAFRRRDGSSGQWSAAAAWREPADRRGSASISSS